MPSRNQLLFDTRSTKDTKDGVSVLDIMATMASFRKHGQFPLILIEEESESKYRVRIYKPLRATAPKPEGDKVA